MKLLKKMKELIFGCNLEENRVEFETCTPESSDVGEQRQLSVRGVGRGAVLLVGERRRSHGSGRPAARSPRHQRRTRQLPSR